MVLKPSEIRAHFMDALLEDNRMYCFDHFIMALCEIDTAKLSLKIVAEYDGEDSFIVRKIYSFEDFFVMQTDTFETVLIFDRSANRFEIYKQKKMRGVIGNAFLYNGKLIMFPLESNANITAFDPMSCKFFTYGRLDDRYKRGLLGKIVCPCLYHEELIFPKNKTASIIRYDLKNKNVTEIAFSISDMQIYQTLFDGASYWSIEENATYLYRSGKYNERISIPNGRYGRLIALNNRICLLPAGSAPVIIYDRVRKELNTYSIPISDMEIKDEFFGKSSRFVNCLETDSDLFLIPLAAKDMYRLQKSDNSVHVCRMHNTKYDDRVARKYVRNNDICYECADIGLQHFLLSMRNG